LALNLLVLCTGALPVLFQGGDKLKIEKICIEENRQAGVSHPMEGFDSS
jgi:hypothetical protein